MKPDSRYRLRTLFTICCLTTLGCTAIYHLASSDSAKRGLTSQQVNTQQAQHTPAIPTQQSITAQNIQLPEPQNPEHAFNTDLLEQPDANNQYPTFGHRVTEIQNRRQGQAFDPETILVAMEQPNAWSPKETLSNDFPLTEEERHDGREFITVNPLKIESLVVGDELEISIQQTNANYIAEINRVEVGPGNNVNWYGQLKNVPDLPGETHLYLTRGETLLVGGITTPNGHFEIQARDTEGWIASAATLFKEVDHVTEVPEETLKQTPAVSEEAVAQNDIPVTPVSFPE